MEISQPFCSCEISVQGCEMALVCQRVVSHLRNTLPNSISAAKWRISRRGGFAAISQLRNEGNCAAKWHSCAKRVLCSCKNFCREGLEATKWFRSKVPISQRLLLGCEISQTLVFPLFLHFSCSKRLSFNFFAIPLDSQLPYFTSFDISPDFDHPKTYITSKQIKIKALKSKLKQVIK